MRPGCASGPAASSRRAVLDDDVVVVAAPGAGAGRRRGCSAPRVVVPPGATGRPGSDLRAKAVAALAAIEAGARRVIVHVGAPDEAAHERDADAKVAAIEAADAQVIGPLAGAVRDCGRHAQGLPGPRLRPGDRRARRGAGAVPDAGPGTAGRTAG